MKNDYPKFITCLLALIFSIVAYAQTDSLYNLAIKKADSFYDFNWSSDHDNYNPENKLKFETSKNLYLKALEIKPNESYPADRIDEIERVLNYFKSLPLIVSADSLLKLNMYSDAIIYYEKSDSLYSTPNAKEKIALSSDAILIANMDSTQKYISIVLEIDSICRAIDNNKNLDEGINEGEFNNQKGGWETYGLKDIIGGSLYRIRHNSSTDFHYKTSFYYFDKKVIKATMTIEDWISGNTEKTIYSAIYYFKNDKLIKTIGENVKYSNSVDILKQGLTFQDYHYQDK